jgi:hypothetical protein
MPLSEPFAMTTGKRSAAERLAALEQQEAQLKARIQRERARLKDAERKADTRRKIIAGAIALEHAEINADFGAELWRVLARHVTRPDDRALLGLPPLSETADG